MTIRRPKHVAIVMDGNGRWAEERGLPRYEGHRAGSESVRRAIEFAVDHGIEVLTLFALSVENRECRPPEEVQFLLSLFLESLRNNADELNKKKVCVRIIGDRSCFNQDLLDQIDYTESLTKENEGLTLVLAINYSGRWDILQATKAVSKAVAAGELSDETLSEREFASYLSLSDLPEPDLLIRTSGELRISNFMLWQFAYTELFFPSEYWPDFDAALFQKAMDAFSKRQRRFGHVSVTQESEHA